MLPALHVRHLAKSYRAGVAGCCAAVRVLEDVNLRVCAGEIVGVCGAGGAGKTTLLLCAAGALRPDRGEVRWFGATARGEARRDAGVAYVAERDARLDVLAVRGARARHAAALSRGALARLAVTRALLERPRLLLVDELLDGLDARWRTSLALLLRTVAAEGVACVAGARDYAALRGVADRIVTLAEGHAASERSAVSGARAGAPWGVSAAVASRRRATITPRVAEGAARGGTWRGSRTPAPAEPPRAEARSVDSPSRAP